MAYQLFYALSFYLVAIAVLITSLRRGFPLVPTVLVMGMGRMGFLLGTWLGAVGGGRSSLFSLVFALTFTLATMRYLRYRFPILDLYALFIPLGLALQRIGCYFAGCCYGIPTDSIFGMNYPEIGVSLHPVPLYFIGAYLSLFILMLLLRKRIHGSGALAMLCLSLCSFSRFGIEFFRDPDSNQMLATSWYGLKQLQWVLALFGTLFFGIFWRLKTRSAEPVSSSITARNTPVGILLCFVTLVGIPYFNRPEWYAMAPILALYVCALLWEMGKWNLPRAILMGTVMAVGVMADVQDSLRIQHTIISGFGYGQYEYPTEAEEGCGGTVFSKYKNSRYSYGELGYQFSYLNWTGVPSYYSAEFSTDLGTYFQDDNGNNTSIRGTNIKGEMTYDWFGLGVGVHNHSRPTQSAISPAGASWFTRFGNFDKAYMKFGKTDDFGLSYFFSFGTFWNHRQSYAELGMGGNEGLYLSLSYRLPWQNLTIENRSVFLNTREEHDLIRSQETRFRILKSF